MDDPDNALIKRRKRSAIMSRMLVTCFTAYSGEYKRGHMGATAEELLVAWALWQDDQPNRIADIAKALSMPRSNVRRSLEALCEVGLAKKIGHAFVPDTSYIKTRIDADYFRRVCEAVQQAADELRLLDAPHK